MLLGTHQRFPRSPKISSFWEVGRSKLGQAFRLDGVPPLNQALRQINRVDPHNTLEAPAICPLNLAGFLFRHINWFFEE